MLNFYFHAGLNLCADEETVARILLEEECFETEEEALYALEYSWDVYGWNACEVSDKIFRAVFDYEL